MAIKDTSLFKLSDTTSDFEDELKEFVRGLLDVSPDISKEEVKSRTRSQFPDRNEPTIEAAIADAFGEIEAVLPEPEAPIQPPEPEPTEEIDTGIEPEEMPAERPEVMETGIFGEPLEVEPVYARDRDTANQITNLDDAIKFAQQYGYPEPGNIAEWNQIREYVPPYEMTPEQKAILQGAVPVTQWNASAALWAGVPANVIQDCINAGGVNVKVVGWGPTDGYLRQFYSGVYGTLSNSEQLRRMGVAPGMMKKLLQDDYEARIATGVTREGGGFGREFKDVQTAIVEKEGVKYRASGEWIVGEDGQDKFVPDGRVMIKELPTSLEEIEYDAISLMKPVEDYKISKPTLPEGYEYGPLNNSLKMPDGTTLFAGSEDEFNNWLMELGAIPSIEFRWPEYEFKFRSFNELRELEARGDVDTIGKDLSLMVESEVISYRDREDYLKGKLSLDDIDKKTGGLYTEPLKEEVPTPEYLQQIRQEIESSPQSFYSILQREGRTVKTEDLLQLLGATEDDIQAIYPGSIPVPRSLAEMQNQYEAINIDELADRLKLLEADGDAEPIVELLKEIAVAVKSEKDIEGWLSDFEKGKVSLSRLTQEVLREYYIYSLNNIYERGRTEEGEFQFRYEKAEDADKERVIATLKKLNVPQNYIDSVLEGVINPAYLLDETRPITQRMDGFMGNLEQLAEWDRDWASSLVHLYLWVKMGDAERKGFWNINVNNPISARARYDMWDAPWGVKGALEIVTNPWYLLPIGGAVSVGLNQGFRGISQLLAKAGAKKAAGVAGKIAEKSPEVIEKVGELALKPITYPLKKAGEKIKSATVKKAAKGIRKYEEDPAFRGSLFKGNIIEEANRIYGETKSLYQVSRFLSNRLRVDINEGKRLAENVLGIGLPDRPQNIARVFTPDAPNPNWRLPHFDPDYTVKQTEYIAAKYPGRIKGNDIQKTTKMAKLLTVNAEEAGEVAANKIRETQSLIGKIAKLIGADEETQLIKDFTKLKLKANTPEAVRIKLSERPWSTGDVMEYYKHFDFTDAKAVGWIESAHKYLDELSEIIIENGIDIPRLNFVDLDDFAREYYPRVVKGVAGLTEAELPAVGGTGVRRIAGKMSHEKRRIFDLMAEGIEGKVQYVDSLEALIHYSNAVYRRIGNEFAGRTLEQFFKAAPLETAIGRYAKWLAGSAKVQKEKAKKLIDVIQRIKRGEVPAGATLNDLKRTFPQFERWLNTAVSMNTKDLPKFISKLNNSFFNTYKITREQFKQTLEEMMRVQIRGAKAKDNALRISDLTEVLSKLNVNNEWKRKIIRDFAKELSATRKEMLNRMLDEARGVFGVGKVALKVAKRTSGDIMDALRRANLTEGFSPETAHIFKDVTVNGKTYTGKYIEDQFKKIFTDKATGLFVIPETVAPLSRALVTAQAALDWSAPLIQGPLLLGVDLLNLVKGKPTAIFARAMHKMFVGTFNKATYRRFLNEYNHIVVEFGQHGLITGVSGVEFVQQLPRAAARLKKVPVAGKVLGTIFEQTYGRFGYSFGIFGDVGRILYIDAMKDTWKRLGHNPRELVHLANVMSGVVSTRALGVSANQRIIESAGLFAPRYIRSQLIVLGQLFSKGATANEIRKVFLGTLAAWGFIYAGTCFALGQKPKFNPLPTEYGGDGGEFLTVTVDEQVFGLPGWANLLRTFVTIFAHLAAMPDRYMKIDWDKVNAMDEVKNDPLLKSVLRSVSAKAAPPINLVKEMVTGRDFLGRKLEDTEDYLMALVEKIVPIAAQSWVSQDKPNSQWAYAAEMLGLKTYPQSKWRDFNDKLQPVLEEYMDDEDFFNEEQLKKLRDGKLTWYDLGAHLQFEILKDYPELKPLHEDAELESARYSTAEMTWYRNMKEQFDNEYKQADAKEFEFARDTDKKYNIKDLRWAISDNKSKKYQSIKSLENDERYTNVLLPYFERIDQLVQGEGNLDRYDRAQEIWFNYVLSDDDAVFDRLTDEEKYIERQRRIDWFRDTFPQEYEYVEESTIERLGDMEPIYVKLHLDKLMLTDSYWRILNDEGEGDKVARMAFRKDTENWKVDAILNFWGYTSSIVSKDKDKVAAQIREWCKEYNIPEEKIPCFGALFVPDVAKEKYKVTQEQWAEYLDIGERYERQDEVNYYRWQYLLANPALNAYLVAEEGRADARIKKLNIPESDKFLKQYQSYDKLRKDDGSSDLKKRRQYRIDNPEFDREGAEYGYWEILPENIIKGVGKPKPHRTEPSIFGK